jgi:hypothetical protein
VPAAGSACTTENAACAYWPNKCYCAGGKWSCYTGVCPDEKPTSGIGCFSHAQQCAYDGSSCICGGIKTWSC